MKKLLPEPFKKWTRTMRAHAIALCARHKPLTREPLSYMYLRGQGVEYGALNWKLALPKGASARYADIDPQSTLLNRYPHHGTNVQSPEVVCSVEELEPFADESLDFFIANHVLEHVQNPVLALKSIHRVLKPGAIAFISLPDKRYTFDEGRKITPWPHIKQDFLVGPHTSLRDHYLEAATYFQKIENEDDQIKWAEESCQTLPDLHFHVWDQYEMLRFLLEAQALGDFRFDIEALSKTGLETIFVLRKLNQLPPSGALQA